MSSNCLDDGIIQAFLDGETGPENSLAVSAHIAVCERCAAELARVEEETADVFAALDRDLTSLVPTQRLWSRINETIEVERTGMPGWQRTLRSMFAAVSTPSFAGAFALAVVAVIGFAALMANEGRDVAFEPASRPVRQTPASPAVAAPVSQAGPTVDVAAADDASSDSFDGLRTGSRSSRAVTARYTRPAASERFEPRFETASYRTSDVRPVTASAAYLPGEESYVKTIAQLRQNVDRQKDLVLTPASRVSFERDMAVVEDSIRKIRDVVRKNPGNQAAKQVLYAAYQDKVDLLNSVAQRGDLMASLDTGR